MTRTKILMAATLTLTAAAVALAQSAKTHRLEARPDTVAYGYYWSEAKPVLRIASGDIIDVDTLLTSTPTTLTRAGVSEDRVQASLKAIVSGLQRTQAREKGASSRHGAHG